MQVLCSAGTEDALRGGTERRQRFLLPPPDALRLPGEQLQVEKLVQEGVQLFPGRPALGAAGVNLERRLL